MTIEGRGVHGSGEEKEPARQSRCREQVTRRRRRPVRLSFRLFARIRAGHASQRFGRTRRRTPDTAIARLTRTNVLLTGVALGAAVESQGRGLPDRMFREDRRRVLGLTLHCMVAPPRVGSFWANALLSRT